MAPPAMAPQQWHAWWHPAMAPQQWHPAMASSNGAQQWHPAMAPSNGLLPLVYHSRPQRLAFLMLRSAADLCRCNKPRLPSQKTPTDANNPPCRSQKPCHCRKKNPRHCRKKNPTPTVAKNPPTNPPSQKNPVTDAKNPKPFRFRGEQVVFWLVVVFLWVFQVSLPVATERQYPPKKAKMHLCL